MATLTGLSGSTAQAPRAMMLALINARCRLAETARVKQEERLAEVVHNVEQIVAQARAHDHTRSAVTLTLDDAFHADRKNRDALDRRLVEKGYLIVRKGNDLSVTVPHHFEHAAPSAAAAEQRKEHHVAMGVHHSHTEAKHAAPAAAAPKPAAAVPKLLIGAVAVERAAVAANDDDDAEDNGQVVDMADFLKTAPEEILQQLHPRSDAVSVRARAHAKMNSELARGISSGILSCKRCYGAFDLFRSPDLCSECKQIVCTKCSTNLPYLEVLLAQESCVCVECWDVVRVKLEVKEQALVAHPKRALLARQEIAYGDKMLLQDPEERANPAEKILIAELNLDANMSAADKSAAAIALASSRKCACCTRGFDMWRRPARCARCTLLVCSSAACVRVVNEVVMGVPFVCCRTCWSGNGKNVRGQLERLRESDPTIYAPVTLDLCIGDKFFVKSKPGEAIQLERALNEALREAEELINKHNRALDNPRIYVSKSPRVNFADSKGKSVTMPQISPRGDAISTRAQAAGKFTADEVHKLERGETLCARCNQRFGVFRSPDRCGECNLVVCSKCCFTLPHLHELLGCDPCACKECWEDIRERLLNKGAKNPDRAARFDAEVALGDRVMYHEDRSSQVERVLAIRAHEKDESGKHVLRNIGFKSPRSDQELLEHYVRKQACGVCKRSYDLFRRPALCTRCHTVVCAGASCVRMVAVGDEHVCCRTCWPELRSELNRAASKIVAPDVFETYAVDIAYGDQFLVMLKPGDHVSLPEQSRAALKVAQAIVAQWRLDHHTAAVTPADHEKKLKESAEITSSDDE